MRAAWYERQGPASEVLTLGEMPGARPGPREVRVRVRVSGVNPGDVKKREGWLGSSMPSVRVIPHSDGAGEIDAVGEEVDPLRVGERVWCFGAQSYRPFGTAAQYVVVPDDQAVRLPDSVGFEQGACLGIPAITAHRAVFGDGPVDGRSVLVAGAAGAVGSMAVCLAAWGGANVIATVRRPEDRAGAAHAGAAHVVVLGERDPVTAIRSIVPDGVERIIEVALDANAEFDASVIAQGGVIAAYATGNPEPQIPFWPLLFENVTIRLLGSDDFPRDSVRQAVADIVACIEEGRLLTQIGGRFPLEEIAAAHEAVEHPSRRGRVVLTVE
jgi:NADPH:quinone reductase